MSRNINRRIQPNTEHVIDVLSETPYAMGAYPVLLFYDAQGDHVSPSVGTLLVEHSVDGQRWQAITNGSVDFSLGVVGEMFRNGRISKIRITTTGLAGVDFIDVNLHVEYDAQQPPETVIADTFLARNIKRGRQFAFVHELSIPSGETRYLAAITGNELVSLKLRQITTNGGMRYTPRRNATFVEDASPLPTTNLNGLSSRQAQTQFYTVTAAPTNEGQQFDLLRSASGVGNNRILGVFGESDIERIIPPNNRSLLKFENLDNSAIFVVIEFSYYEGPTAQLPEDM